MLLRLHLLSFLTVISLGAYSQNNTPLSRSRVASGSATVATLPSAYTNAPANHVRTWEPQRPYSTDTEVASESRTVAEVRQATQYIDGLGRPLQTVMKQTTPSYNDMVAPIVYDAFGREQYKYLPYASTANDGAFKTNPFNDQSSFYTNTYKIEQPAFTNEQYFYGKTIFEASPLNRVEKSFAPGNSWAGSEGINNDHSTQMQYLINDASDAVRIWSITHNSLTYSNNDVTTNIPTSSAFYNAGELYKNVTIDEHSKKVVEYKGERIREHHKTVVKQGL